MRKENLFGFGKGSSKLQSSSRLEKQAYDAGYRGVDGWHGTHYFDAWLKGQGDKKEWSSGLVSRLKAEYKRGGVEYEADRLLKKAKASSSSSSSPYQHTASSGGGGRGGRRGMTSEDRTQLRREKADERAQIRREKADERAQIRREQESLDRGWRV